MTCRFWTGVRGSCWNGDWCPYKHPKITGQQLRKNDALPPVSTPSEKSTATVKDAETITDTTGDVASRKRTRCDTEENVPVDEKKITVTPHTVTLVTCPESDPVTHQDVSGSVTSPSSSTNRYKELCDTLAESLNRLEKEDNKQLAVHMNTLYKLLADAELSLLLSLS